MHNCMLNVHNIVICKGTTKQSCILFVCCSKYYVFKTAMTLAFPTRLSVLVYILYIPHNNNNNVHLL